VKIGFYVHAGVLNSDSAGGRGSRKGFVGKVFPVWDQERKIGGEKSVTLHGICAEIAMCCPRGGKKKRGVAMVRKGGRKEEIGEGRSSSWRAHSDRSVGKKDRFLSAKKRSGKRG